MITRDAAKAHPFWADLEIELDDPKNYHVRVPCTIQFPRKNPELYVEPCELDAEMKLIAEVAYHKLMEYLEL